MQNQFRVAEAAEMDDDTGSSDLLETVSSLRHDVDSLTADLQRVLAENAKLRRRLQQGEQVETRSSVSDLHRVKREIDELARRYDRSRGRCTDEDAPSRPAFRRRELDDRALRRGNRTRLREMMMMMIMSELF